MAESFLGLEAKAYFLSTGTRASWGAEDTDTGIHAGSAPGSLTEMGNVRDVTLKLDKGEADVTTRSSGGWRQMRGTLKDAEVTFEMIYDPADDSYAVIQAAFLLNTPVAMAFLSGASDVSGVEGLWADFDVTGFEKTEPLEEAQKASVTIKPTRSDVAPEWVKVA